MKVLYKGKEIEFKTKREKGELELDLITPEERDLEDTIDLKETLEKIQNDEIAFSDTGEIKREEF